ncbi:MAG TPA: hypothetical protein DD640_06830 [Clostridiales bacterium]|nr:hypothetical protein [Clostridiales bacterium]
MNKNQFMRLLQQELHDLGPTAVSDILADFEEHFASALALGKTEAEITTELGDPLEIAQQYKESAADDRAARPSPTTPEYQHQDQDQAPSGAAAQPLPRRAHYADVPYPAAQVKPSMPTKINGAALLAVILLNVFLGIPIWISLYCTLFGFWVAAGSIGVAACVLFTVAILKSGIASLILVLFGIALTALTILAIILMVYLTKWLCIGLSRYVRWNRKWVTGGSQT